MLFFLFRNSLSEWWQYNAAEYQLYENNSFRHPIFAVCTSTRCPHCKGLPEALHAYSDMVGNNTKVVFTNINCAETSFCPRVPVRGVPAFVLIRGPDPKYWVQTYERNFLGWGRFLEQTVKAHAVELTNPADLSREITKTFRGSTTFFLSVPENDAATLKAYKRTVPDYHPMGCTFLYKKEGTVAKITAYRSPNCFISKEITADEIPDFVEANKYSSYHHFTRHELTMAISKNISVFVTVGQDNLNQEQHSALDQLSTKHCGKMEFGWAEKESDNDVIHFSKMSGDDVPYYFSMNPREKCYHIQKGFPSEPTLSQFMQNTFEAKQCKKLPVVRSGYKIAITKTAVIAAGIIVGILCISYFIWEISRDSPLKLE
ncbi:hypothetical protein TVAG_319450 [Trichomonas vaginalis G3]|uniref:Thioredoxin domain-containing protein n=1 Tax=Trichomonas vaginalis (strain ATCC PRA-98 / G3) TaxID=412133 RepID=A2DQ93_TRIV3|nr:thioredoxin-like family [Trichomonas vaginalis G3]EAY17350.1 hypothetical protein TVAG_319450 [Trichomonas vaginalis G3]KAI5491358.1 thioredoxin-like family [Trichomonas vaginalis G3]|eukprot:XP_001330719.1 hypothetical protein [Trichomonas vaginalis G3]